MDQTMTLNFCTLCDSNYLLKGLALKYSLDNTIKAYDYVLHWLCLDDETYRKLDLLNDPKIVLYKLSDFEEQDEELRKAKSNPPSKYGSQRDNYIWSLTPYFVNFLLKNIIPDREFLTYCDSDIYFYKSPSIILSTIGDKSIGIHTHRFGPNRKKLDVGWYNVGVTVFRKDKPGLEASKLWKRWTMDTSNPFYLEYGTCGDQKYLEVLYQQFPSETCVFDEEGPVSHLAPWCTHLDHNKPVVFFHFSHFTFDLQTDTWRDSVRGEWNPSRVSHIKQSYEQYFKTIKFVNKLIQ